MAFVEAQKPITRPGILSGKLKKPRTPHRADELQELAETFGQMVERLSNLMQEVDDEEVDDAHARALQAEIEKKHFYQEVIRSVTLGKFELVEREALPELGRRIADLPVQDGPQYAVARDAIQKTAETAGMSEERGEELVLAAGEAITNAMKHAHGGRCVIYATDDSVIVRVSDEGGGIASKDIPAVVLMPGFSTKVSLGMGYTLILKLSDHVWLSTDPTGTTLQMEKKLEPVPDTSVLTDPLSRF
jgi:anti-sigma regulatory factor (Ser/Thr protein kinase)